ncbi:MAG: globin domain-containing protein [Ignavibacteria bacterium]
MAEWDILSKEDIKLIQDSFGKLSDKYQETGDILYKHLFETSPEVTKIFKGDMSEQARTFMRMIKTVVEGLNNIHIIMPAIQSMGSRHVDYGVAPEQYSNFKKSLMFAFDKVLGKDFDEKTKDAWSRLYDVLQDLMKSNN